MLETDKDFLPAWSPDGEKVAYFTMLFDSLASFSVSLRTVSVSTGEVAVVRELGSLIVHGLDWSPDGEWMVFSSVQGLHEVHISGGIPIQLTRGKFHTSPSWSSARNLIFFSEFAYPGLSSVLPTGLDLRQWPWSDRLGIGAPSCFPNSDSLTVYTIQDSEYCLAVQNPDDTVITSIQLCGFAWMNTSRVSPDGALIAFNAAYKGTPASNLYLFNREDQSIEQLNSKASEGLDFSPYGTQLVHADLGIVYAESGYEDLRGTRGLQIINLDDRTVLQLTPGYR